MRLVPGLAETAQKPGRLSFETHVLVLALLVALPALLALAIVLWWYVPRGGWPWFLVPALLATLLLAYRLRHRVVFPLYTLSNLLEALREGDFSLRGSRARRGDAIGDVVWEVNALSETLREQRLRVEETLALLTKVMQEIDIAVLTFDDHQRVRLANPAAARLLGLPPEQALGQTAASLGIADCLDGREPRTVRRDFPGGSGRFELSITQFRQGGVPHDLLVISDLSRALREEERVAWQRLIRVLGHELNNSLAPIKSMAQSLHSILGREPLAADWREDLVGGLRLIGDRAESLNRFMSGYTTLAKLPPPQKREVAVAELLQRVAALETRRRVVWSAAPDLQATFDPDQVEQALINVVRNAAEASPEGAEVTITATREAGRLSLRVRDQGPGLPPSDNLFVPFFTTKPGGSGIGLVLTRQIVEAHGGRFTITNAAGGGAEARLLL